MGSGITFTSECQVHTMGWVSRRATTYSKFPDDECYDMSFSDRTESVCVRRYNEEEFADKINRFSTGSETRQ